MWITDIILFPEEQAEEPSIQVLSSDDFYQHPVELETVTTNELLGFLVDPVKRTVTYKLLETWQIRDFASAGSIRLRLSGLQSRCHLISRYSFPATGRSRLNSLIDFAIWSQSLLNLRLLQSPYANCKKVF